MGSYEPKIWRQEAQPTDPRQSLRARLPYDPRLEQLERELMYAGLLTGYDMNVLRIWRERGAHPGSVPELSHQINGDQIATDQRRREELEKVRYKRWLEHATARTEDEAERRLLREYPDSFPAWKQQQEWLQAKEKHERERQLQEEIARGRREYEERLAAEAEARWQQEEEERRRLEADRAVSEMRFAIDSAMHAVLEGEAPITSVSSGDYLYWCEHMATPAELQKLDERLSRDAAALEARARRERFLRRLTAPFGS